MLAVGTLDTVNDLPLALRLIRFAMRADGAVHRRHVRRRHAAAAPRRHARGGCGRGRGCAACPSAHRAVGACRRCSPTPGFSDPVVDVDRVAGLLSFARAPRRRPAGNGRDEHPHRATRRRSRQAAARRRGTRLCRGRRRTAAPSKPSKSFTSRPGRLRERMKRPLTLSAVRVVNPASGLNPPRGRGPEEGGVIAIRKTLRMLGADQRGATAIEYGLIAALIVIAMIGGLQSLGGGVGGMWGKLDNVDRTPTCRTRRVSRAAHRKRRASPSARAPVCCSRQVRSTTGTDRA